MAEKPIIKKGKNKGWDNLIPIKKGEVRNPGGRPKKALCIPDILNKIGEEKVPDVYLKVIQKLYPGIKNITHREALQRLAYHYAFKGQSWAFNYIAERTEGKPIEKPLGDTDTPDLTEIANAIRESDTECQSASKQDSIKPIDNKQL